MTTFRSGVETAIHLLSTHIPTSFGRYCSAADLTTVVGPSHSMKVVISHLQDSLGNEGTFEDGIHHVINVLQTKKVGRDPEYPDFWTLVPEDIPTVENQLYISALQRILEPAG